MTAIETEPAVETEPAARVGTPAAAAGAPDPAGAARAPRTLAGTLAGVASSIALRVPERVLVALADAAGELWYRVTPGRAARARANLRRVVTHLSATGRGSDRVRGAAADDRALERLVRSAYRHAARYYTEVARTPAYDDAYLAGHLVVESPELVEQALVPDRPLILVGLHFGALEMPAVYVGRRVGRAVTAPMEAVPDPGLQAWFVRSRGRVGMRIVTLAAARRALAAALARGEPVGLVADRDITGGGLPVPFFGSPAPMPVGPALLAVESGAPVYVAAARRSGPDGYRGRMLAVETPAEGPRRTRVAVLVERLAVAFEELIADAPDQWWACFQPIWPDLEPEPRR